MRCPQLGHHQSIHAWPWSVLVATVSIFAPRTKLAVVSMRYPLACLASYFAALSTLCAL